MFSKQRSRTHQTLATCHTDEGCALALVDHAAADGPRLTHVDWLAGDPARATHCSLATPASIASAALPA